METTDSQRTRNTQNWVENRLQKWLNVTYW